MAPPPGDSWPDSTGPPDRQTLRLLERHLTSDALVTRTKFEPDPYEPRQLQVSLDSERYPESISAARLDVRWFTTGDFSIHYIEDHTDGTQWECRWDRHPNPHTTRLHFHQPPTADEITELSFGSLHPFEVYSTVLGAIEQHIESLWSNQ